MSVDRLYPKVEFPVSRQTKSISSYIRWDHKDNWFVPIFKKNTVQDHATRDFEINLTDSEEEYLVGHNLDGRIILPASYYIKMVWETLSHMLQGSTFLEIPVEFQDIRLIRATSLSLDKPTVLTVVIHYGTGKFEVTESGALVATGYVREVENPQPIQPVTVPDSSRPMLLAQDFYKVLRLRGYHYAGAFKGILEARGDGILAKIKWSNNWVTFFDYIFQFDLFRADTNSLIVPTRIRKLRILAMYHNQFAETNEHGEYFDVYYNPYSKRFVCGGVEITGSEFTAITRRKPPGLPVLETYKFVPNLPAPKLRVIDVARICIQFSFENEACTKIKVVEINHGNRKPIIQNYFEALDGFPLVTGEFMLLTSEKINITGVVVENKNIESYTKCTFIISEKLLKNEEELLRIAESIGFDGYIVSIESSSTDLGKTKMPQELSITAFFPTEEYTIVLIRYTNQMITPPTIIKLPQDDTEFNWIQTAQSGLLRGSVLFVAQNDKFSGVIGLVNCLRKEKGCEQATCFLIQDPNAPPFDLQHPLYADQLKLKYATNIYKNGQWGTYRRFPLHHKPDCNKPKRLAYADILHRGDLSSLNWLEGPALVDNCEIKVYFSSLNFRDIMLATGRISMETLECSRLYNKNLVGFEYAGVGKDGIRYMGMTETSALATHVIKPSRATLRVPDHWTLEVAASVPCLYYTLFYAFFKVTDIRKGKSILIHAGAGGIGQSAIHIALSCNLEIFTTVSTETKKKMLLEKFPKLKESHIGNSRNTSFEFMVSKETNGNGVDFVVNSLSEDKLFASVRCLGKNGHFFEIGKFDIQNNSKIDLEPFKKNISFHSIYADRLMQADESYIKEINDLIYDGIRTGLVVPLPTTVFKTNELEKAFRYMSSGKHIGKVLIQIHDEATGDLPMPITPIPQIYFESDLVYIIPGGLGGVGLEMTDWMILKGARKIVFCSRNGITKSYQAHKIKLWETYGATIRISTDNICTYEGCKSLITDAMDLGPIGGIFNLALVLQDALFMNQTTDQFKKTIYPKSVATKYLDELSRRMCPKLQHFVVFSSVSCGLGNGGQTNYGMGNSIMERLIENRVADGFPGKAIEWGAIGEVGIIADYFEKNVVLDVIGTMPQRISSCLQTLNEFFTTSDPICCSMVLAEKRTFEKESIFETVLRILGVRDIKAITMDSSLAEVGMDSLMIVEIQQALESDFDIALTMQEMRAMTFQTLLELSNSK